MMSRSHDLFHPELKMTHFSNRTELEKKRFFTWCKLFFNYSDICFYFYNDYLQRQQNNTFHTSELQCSCLDIQPEQRKKDGACQIQRSSATGCRWHCNPTEHLIRLRSGSSDIPSSVSWKSSGQSGPSCWLKLIYFRGMEDTPDRWGLWCGERE